MARGVWGISLRVPLCLGNKKFEKKKGFLPSLFIPAGDTSQAYLTTSLKLS